MSDNINNFLNVSLGKPLYEHQRQRNTRETEVRAGTKQLLRELKCVDSLQKRIDRANAKELVNFRLRLEMEDMEQLELDLDNER